MGLGSTMKKKSKSLTSLSTRDTEKEALEEQIVVNNLQNNVTRRDEKRNVFMKQMDFKLSASTAQSRKWT